MGDRSWKREDGRFGICSIATSPGRSIVHFVFPSRTFMVKWRMKNNEELRMKNEEREVVWCLRFVWNLVFVIYL